MTEKRSFLTWNRDNQAAFAAEIKAEIKTGLESKADTDSPVFTGIPTAPTAEAGTNTEQIATTKFVATALSEKGDGAADKVSKTGDTITGLLSIIGNNTNTARFSITNELAVGSRAWSFVPHFEGTQLDLKVGSTNIITVLGNVTFAPASNNTTSLGLSSLKWTNVFAAKLNNGADIEIPTKAGKLALLSDIEDVLRQHGLIS